jgi:amino-acid N-acetyltransferase
MQDVAYLFATPDDIDDIKHFLSRFRLPTGGVDPNVQNFLMVKSQSGLLGTLGLEAYGKTGILRSFAVETDARGAGIGREMYFQMLEHARSLGITELYLLTTSAELYFSKRGFEKVERKAAPIALTNSIEFKTACPKSAVCMRLKLT